MGSRRIYYHLYLYKSLGKSGSREKSTTKGTGQQLIQDSNGYLANEESSLAIRSLEEALKIDSTNNKVKELLSDLRKKL